MHVQNLLLKKYGNIIIVHVNVTDGDIKVFVTIAQNFGITETSDHC